MEIRKPITVSKNVITCKLSQLKEWQYNAKKHPDDQIEYIVKMIKKVGFINPIIIDEDHNILAGHGRKQAAKKLNMSEVPCIMRAGLSEEDKRAYRIFDNKIGETGWNMDLLKEDMLFLDHKGYELEMTGFELDEIDSVIPKRKGLNESVEDKTPEEMIEVSAYERTKQKTKIKIGDVYKLGDHRLMCGDATKEEDVKLLMQDEKADLILTDPPYGINIVNSSKVGITSKTGFVGTEGLVKAKKYKIIEGDHIPYNPAFLLNYGSNCDIILWGANNFSSKLNDNSHWIIWDKKCEIGADHNNFSDVELAWTNIKRKSCVIYRHLWSGLLREGSRKEELKERNHPTQKPVGLHVSILNDYSKKEDLILDFYGGSGTTLIACEKVWRKCRMMELDPVYCQVIIDRWEKYTGNKAIKVE